MLKAGDLLRYYYLWAREADAGEESGRKARPVCIVSGRQQRAQLVSLSADFAKARPVAPASRHQRNRMPPRRLDYPSWLILDEFNRVQVDEAYDLVTTKPIGAFSPAFVRKIARVIKETAAQRRLRGIVRK